VLDYKHLCNV